MRLYRESQSAIHPNTRAQRRWQRRQETQDHMKHVISVALLIAGVTAGCAAAVPPVSPAPAAQFLPSRLEANQGVLFAVEAGGTIEARTGDGATKSLNDGSVVEIKDIREAEMGDADSSVEIVSDGVTYTVGVAQVLREDSLTRSPDGAFAVFHVIVTCGDLCHSTGYVVTSAGKRVLLGDGVVDLAVAWRKDGKELAVGSGALWIVSLSDLAVRKLEEYTAPAYAPDGTLYVRDHEGSAYILAATAQPEQVWKAPEQPEPEEGDYGAGDPEPVAFGADGAPSYTLE
jgi:hypothetical protein